MTEFLIYLQNELFLIYTKPGLSWVGPSERRAVLDWVRELFGPGEYRVGVRICPVKSV